MGRQDKKKRKDNRGRIQSKSTCSFPIDLTAEILSRLPEKSIARFRCVSKVWSSITTDPYFINLLETRFPRPSLLLCITKGDDLFVASIPQHTKSWNKFYSSSQPIHRYHMKLPEEHSFYPTGMESVHGLVCFTQSQNLVVWNPSTRQFLTLPKPKMSSRHKIVFFGYDPIEGKHKVVCVPYKKTCYVCRVFTLGSGQESWRTVRANPKHRCGYDYMSGRCIKGVIYYLTRDCQEFDLVLMSFDVRSEKFHMIELPSDIHEDVLITYEGKLACACENNKTRLWVLEDAEEHKWSCRDFHSPFQNFLSTFRHHDPSLRTRFRLKGCTHTGEFIYVPNKFHKSLYILFYDPVRNSCRRFEFEGIFEDQFGLYNGVKNGLIYSFDAFPNHIESRMSL